MTFVSILNSRYTSKLSLNKYVIHYFIHFFLETTSYQHSFITKKDVYHFSFEIQTSLLIPLNMISMDLFHEYFINVEPQKEMWPYKQFCCFCCCSCCCCLRFLTHVLSYIAKVNLNWHRKAAEVVIFGSHRNVTLSWLSLLFHKFLRSNKILVIFPNGVDLHHMVELATEYILSSKCSFLGLCKHHSSRSFQLMKKLKRIVAAS